MTTKKAIIISAATCLAVNIVLSILAWMGWLILPLVWVGSGYAGLQIIVFLEEEPADTDDLKLSLVMGPFVFVYAVCVWAKEKIKWPKFRNPFYHEAPPTDSNPSS